MASDLYRFRWSRLSLASANAGLNALVASGQYILGNSGRNILVGPKVEFRAEVFKALNTPQFNNPNSSIGFAGVARITSAGNPPIYQRTSRQIQMALKIYF